MLCQSSGVGVSAVKYIYNVQFVTNLVNSVNKDFLSMQKKILEYVDTKQEFFIGFAIKKIYL